MVLLVAVLQPAIYGESGQIPSQHTDWRYLVERLRGNARVVLPAVRAEPLAAADLSAWRCAHRCASNFVNAAEAAQLPAVASVLACEALVAALVVSSEASHQLLGFCTRRVRCLGQEVLGVVPSERCRNAPMMEDLDVAILAASVGEAEVRGLGSGFGGHGVRGVSLCGLTFEQTEPLRHAAMAPVERLVRPHWGFSEAAGRQRKPQRVLQTVLASSLHVWPW